MKTMKFRKSLFSALLSMGVMLSIGSDAGAAPGCRTNSVNVSTGINTATGALLPVGISDPGWKVVARSADLNAAVPGLPAVPTPAKIVSTQSGWVTSSSGQWISFYDPGSAPWYQAANTALTYSFTLEREFELCDTGRVSLSVINFARDNYMQNFRVISKPSNTVIYSITASDPVANTSSNFNTLATVPAAAIPGTLAAGKYAIQITIYNYPQAGANPNAFIMTGSVSATNNALLKPGYLNCACEEYSCDDKCYWRVDANNITMGTAGLRNLFGTLTDDDIRVVTNGTTLSGIYRGVIRGGSATTGGYFGWNTNNPTARWHVNCLNGNNTTGTSDIRFENLESGTGNQLAIDGNGYVYNSGIPVGGGSGSGTSWDVNGNVIGSNNIFGTLSPDDVRLFTNGNQRGIFTSGTASPFDDGRLGWQTNNPTAHLHIGCRNGNPDDGSMGSDVRFEDLENGSGNILVIDSRGYVYDSKIPLTADGATGKKEANEQHEKITQLETQLAAMQAKLDELMSCCSATKVEGLNNMPVNSNALYQNVPNPFGKETSISYYIKEVRKDAYILITDLTGKQLLRYPIAGTGKGEVTVNGESLTAGIYLYSLVIDGREIDSKRMVFSK